MSQTYRVLAYFLVLSVTSAFGQGNSDQNRPDREFLKPIDAEQRGDLMRRRGLEIRSEEFFAKPSRFEVYKFNIEVLESKGETITLTPFNGPPIEIVSNGIERESGNGWFLGKWSGEVKIPNSKKTFPIEWRITTWSIDAFGRLQPPDPNREYTLSQLEQESAVIPEESYLRLNEKLVYSIVGGIVLPHTGTQIRIAQPKDDLDYLMIYELDTDKYFRVIDGPDDPAERDTEIVRREKAYRDHVENVKRELGISQN